MLTVRDAIKETKLKVPFDIEFRFSIPEADIFDELFGFARWDGASLISLDGDSYFLNEEIIFYEEIETTDGEKMLSITLLSSIWTDEDQKKYNEAKEPETEKALFAEHKRTRAERRHNNIKKAIRKRKISEKHYGWSYYENLHQYSKNKIHCSCNLCRAKTNPRAHKGITATSCKHGKYWAPSDLRKIMRLEEEEKEFSVA